MRIVRGGMGGFLAPPGHPTHDWSVEDGPGRDTQRGPSLIASLDYAVQNEHGEVPRHLQEHARKLFADAVLVRSEAWERQVYGYFRGCYSPDGVNRKVADAVIFPKGTAAELLPPPEHHLAYLLVRTYFPDATPRLDLIENSEGGYGTQPCRACGTTLQYEARADAWAEPITARTACPQGGEHRP